MPASTIQPALAKLANAPLALGRGPVTYAEDLSGRIASWSPVAEGLFGWSAAEALGKSAMSLVPLAQIESWAVTLTAVENGQSRTDLLCARKRKGGGLVHLKLAVVPVYNAFGRVVGIAHSAEASAEAMLSAESVGSLIASSSGAPFPT